MPVKDYRPVCYGKHSAGPVPFARTLLRGADRRDQNGAVAALERLFLGPLFQKATCQKPRTAQHQSSCVITWNVGLLDKIVCFVCAAFGVYRFTLSTDYVLL